MSILFATFFVKKKTLKSVDITGVERDFLLKIGDQNKWVLIGFDVKF